MKVRVGTKKGGNEGREKVNSEGGERKSEGKEETDRERVDEGR